MAALVLFTCAAGARPLLVPPQNLALPPQLGTLFYYSVAIDSGTLLASARSIDPQSDPVNGVYIFERDAAGSWAYAGVLTEQWPGDVMLNGTVATTRSVDGIKVFERGAAGWALTGAITVQNSFVFRIEDGSIYVRQEDPFSNRTCVPPYQQFRKLGGIWTQVATIGGQRCDQNQADINDGRAIVVHTPLDSPTPQPPAETFAASSGSTWTPIGSIPAPPPGPINVNWFGPWGTIRGDTAFIDRGYFYRYSGGAWVRSSRLVEPEIELTPNSLQGKLRGNNLFLYGHEVDYELPSTDPDTLLEWHVLRVYRQSASGAFIYHARLNPAFDLFDWAVSDDGRQVAAYGGHTNNTTFAVALRLYVFEVPDTASFPGTTQDTFSSGNFARWTPTAGTFAVVQSGVTRVLRQSSLAGDAAANLTAIDWTDQSIEADMRPLEFAGPGRWFGLVTRRTDARNYYYVRFRASNGISLRRMRDGVVSELAWAPAPANFQTGHNYRMRLESVGDQHAVFMDGIPQLHVKDSTLTHGHPGVAGYRTRFDADNVIVSGGTRVLMRLDGGLRAWSDGWRSATGTWAFAYEGTSTYLRQSDNQAEARWFSKIAVGYQSISTRVRPLSHGVGSDPWIGLAAHVVDDSNYYYLTLRRSQQLSLRRLVNGQVQILATVPQALTLGAWHDLRLEIIGTHIRAYVNGDLRIETTDSTLSGSGGGRNALLMSRTAADVASYVAYQP